MEGVSFTTLDPSSSPLLRSLYGNANIHLHYGGTSLSTVLEGFKFPERFYGAATQTGRCLALSNRKLPLPLATPQRGDISAIEYNPNEGKD